MSHGSALRQRFGATADEFVAVLFMGFVDVVEVFLRIVAEFSFDLLPDASYLLDNGAFHLKPPSPLPAGGDDLTIADHINETATRHFKLDG